MLRYFDYVFTGVFTFEMIIKVGIPNNMMEHYEWVECLVKVKNDSILRGSETKYYNLEATRNIIQHQWFKSIKNNCFLDTF